MVTTPLKSVLEDLRRVLDRVNELERGVEDEKVRRLLKHSYEHLDGAYTVLSVLSELEPLWRDPEP